MEVLFQRAVNDNANISLVPLIEVKRDLRISHTDEDDLIQRKIDGSISFFENQTNFFITKGSLILSISDKDIAESSRRSKKNAYNLFKTIGFNSNIYKFFAPCSVTSPTLTGASFIYARDSESDIEELSFDQSQISELIDPFILINDKSLEFLLNVKVFLGDGSYQVENIRLTFDVNIYNPLPNDISEAVIRGACMNYERPTENYNVLNDATIANAITKYNSARGI